MPGVREITIDDIEIGEKIGQGGFSTIHVGKLNGTPVAIKKIFDPRLTDELLNEIQNEIVMQSILRHPGIVMLMGVIPQIPNLYIVQEHVQQGSLYDMLHVKKQMTALSLSQSLQIAIDSSIVFEYMHHLGIAHRDIKSHNVLIDHNFNVKICDFGLAKFTVSLNSHQIFLTFIFYFFRLILVKVRCNMQVHQRTWLLNFSRKGNMISRLMCLHLAACSGR